MCLAKALGMIPFKEMASDYEEWVLKPMWEFQQQEMSAILLYLFGLLG